MLPGDAQGLPCSGALMLLPLTLLSLLEFFLRSCPGLGFAARSEAVAAREGREAAPSQLCKMENFPSPCIFHIFLGVWCALLSSSRGRGFPADRAPRPSSGSLDEELHVFRAVEVGISFSPRLCPQWILEVG